MAIKKETMRTGWREAWGIVLLAAGVLTLLSQVSYDPWDIPVLQSPPNSPPANFVGPVGAWLSFIVFMAVGVAGYLVSASMAALGLAMIFSRESRIGLKVIWLTVLLLAVVCVAELQPDLWGGLTAHLNVPSPGGGLGLLLAQGVVIRLLNEVGAAILSAALILVSLVFLFEIRPVSVLRQMAAASTGLYRSASAAVDAYRDRRKLLEREERDIARKRKRLERSMRQQGQPAEDQVEKALARTVDDVTPAEPQAPASAPPPAPEPEPVSPPAPRRKRRPKAAAPAPDVMAAEDATPGTGLKVEYQLPSIDLLQPLPVKRGREATPDFSNSAAVLEETLSDFGIESKVTHVERGPVVTRYQVLPAAGVRVERIASLSNNIALALKAVSVRVQAPIPGKGVVGIEVPNAQSTTVYLREVLESEEWQSGKHALPLALGKDVGGRVLVADLAAMPHLLIAGATGAGKTVCMNSLLSGLLMTRKPDEMQLMLIDPKIVEFTPYNGLPHLVVPVITDPKKVPLGLRWAINEMEKRYKLFARAGVRNIASYNSRPIEKQASLFDEEDGAGAEPDMPDRIPYIVVVVDELADLMLVAQAEIENSIARLAQLSRAVGIHMIIATQRPSVNVITGTIKANFPARIAFQVAQRVDSRTILDTIGADKLLGRGDMLFLPPGSSKLTRAQGSMTTDDETRAIVAFACAQGQPEYIAEIKEKIESKSVELPEVDEEDELLEAAVEIIRQTRRASTSSLQRRLRIGYTRAARLMDMLEERGIVGPPQGSDPREILIDLEGEIPQNESVE